MGPWAIPLLIGAIAMIFGGPVVGLLTVIVALMVYPQFAEWERQRREDREVMRRVQAELRAKRDMLNQAIDQGEADLRRYRRLVRQHYRVLSCKRSVGMAVLYAIALPIAGLFLLFG